MRNRFEDFAECLLVGLLITLAAVPVVTAAPAFAAGCRALRRSAAGVSRPLWPTFWADFRSLARGGIPFTAATSGLALLLTAELLIAGPVMPGATVVVPALGVLGVVTVVLALRTCAVIAERPGAWRQALADAARATVRWPSDALLLAGAAAAAGALVWMQPLLLAVVGGPLALAALATGVRR